MKSFPCPCCGFVVFSGPPGTEEMCPICGWQDDLSQLRFPGEGGGANQPSLVEAQKNFARLGASTETLVTKVRAPSPLEQKDPTWRPILPSDFDVTVDGAQAIPSYPSDRTQLYYWKDIYWLNRLRRR